MIEVYTDEYFMKIALEEAKKAALADEIPIGAVVVYGKQILSKAHNQTELLQDVTAHAEILAITAAAQNLNSKYLKDCTLYVTLEPCPMCAGALRWAQVSRLVYAAEDEKMGYLRFGNGLLHPRTSIEYGLLQAECSALLRQFFETKRKEKSKPS
ncbi:MAG TPA: nucleoside deaminase [Saprospiraceae bacterium]|nr:nucleoside deaminase [Saprospiraceae bacterium]